jgi:hypothetical protein
MPELNYEMAPKPGQTVSQRLTELGAAKFVSVRNLAYMLYKKPDGQPLLSYSETLDNREIVKTAIIQYELAQGLLVDDRGSVAALPQPQPVQPVAQMQGAPQMAQQPPVPITQFPPPATAQQAAQMAPPQYQQQMMPPPQYQQPPPQMAPQPQMAPPQMAPPAAAPQVAAAAGEPAPVSRRRRGAGAAVAPPPAAPPPPVQQPVYGAPQPVPQAAAPQFAPPPPPPSAPAPQAAPVYQQPQMPQPPQPGLDLNVLAQKLDMIGKGIEIAANNSDQTMKMMVALAAELTETRLVTMQALTCLHHLYGANFAQSLQGVDTLDKFRTFLMKFIGQLPAVSHPK